MLIPLGILDFPTGGAGAYELIESNILTSSASSVTFSSIPQDYKHLQIRYVGKTDWGASSGQNNLTFNSDTGSNYAYHLLFGNGSSVSSLGYTTRSFIFGGLVDGSNPDTNEFGVGVMDILDYANTSKNTTTRVLHGITGGTNRIDLSSGLWMNTSAVSTITLTSAQGSYVSGSRFSLYGLRG